MGEAARREVLRLGAGEHPEAMVASGDTSPRHELRLAGKGSVVDDVAPTVRLALHGPRNREVDETSPWTG